MKDILHIPIFDSLEELRFICPPAQNFHPDAAGFIALIEHEYKSMCSADKNYCETIPESVHAYYCIIIYWYKIALQHKRLGISTKEEQSLLYFIDGYGTIKIGAGMALYLSGLGDYKDMMGVKHRLVATKPNNSGHFGPIDSENHVLYNHLPAPAVALERVLQDVIQNDTKKREMWIIEDIINQGTGTDKKYVPTANLLGWKPTMILSTNQFHTLKDILGKMPDRNKLDLINSNYVLHRGLFELVLRKTIEVKRYKLMPIPKTTTGSVVQQCTWFPVENTSPYQLFVSGEGQLKSSTFLPILLVTAGRIMCYRAFKDKIDDEDGRPQNSWCVMSFHGSEVPKAWLENRNCLVERGNDFLINYTPFSTSISNRNSFIIEFLRKFES